MKLKMGNILPYLEEEKNPRDFSTENFLKLKIPSEFSPDIIL
jgi:hypothetical protein